jgi:signal peptidase I
MGRIDKKQILFFLKKRRRLVHIVVVLVGIGTLVLLFVKYALTPQEYEALNVYLFSDDVIYHVEGKSMFPTLQDQQMWYGSRCEEKNCWNSIQRGDLIVFDARNAPGKQGAFLKRVIGIPLDHITITEGKVYINNHLLIEPYITIPTVTNSSHDCQRYDVGPEQVFVLGDNRSHSNDSRVFGAVDFEDIWGVSPFEKYNPMASPPKLDVDREFQVDELKCPLWIGD